MENQSQNTSILNIASLVLAVGLLLCLCHMPYGFYSVIRLSTAIVACCWAYQFYKASNTPLTVIAIAVAILFQPLIKIVLDRSTWHTIDIILAIALLILVMKPNGKSSNS